MGKMTALTAQCRRASADGVLSRACRTCEDTSRSSTVRLRRLMLASYSGLQAVVMANLNCVLCTWISNGFKVVDNGAHDHLDYCIELEMRLRERILVQQLMLSIPSSTRQSSFAYLLLEQKRILTLDTVYLDLMAAPKACRLVESAAPIEASYTSSEHSSG
jgi:hypothetical protein